MKRIWIILGLHIKQEYVSRKELAVLRLIYKNPSIKQKELAAETGKSLSTVKRIMESLQKKDYIRRVDGKRYGKWEVLI
ncbi:winged helix-turn-helix domain-containing protein [Blautia sp. AM46-5]|nr:winged helix-turn-helix domain-containing protein [Blautia sp. AM46-5]RHS55283.1 winged helix-turn-helix domain-containing protein [Blautia sp. AM46-3MH]